MIKLPDESCKKLNYLIVLPSQTEMNSKYMFPLGFGMISSALKASGRNVLSLNLTYKNNPLRLLYDIMTKNNINILITGGMSPQYQLIKEIIDIAKDINAITIVGGGIITAEPVVAMQALGNADYGIIGEGEITINNLAYALETNSLLPPGVIEKKTLEYKPVLSEIMDLDCLPFPDYDGFEYVEMQKWENTSNWVHKEFGMPIALSRSCPYRCTFCFHTNGMKYRRRTLDNVFEEIDWLVSKYTFNHLAIYDELFGKDEEYIQEFCARIKPYSLSYFISLRLDSPITDDSLELLKESGCVQILFGVEHVDDRILDSMKKKTKRAMIAPMFEKVMEKGIRASGMVIFGDLEETPETVRAALAWLKEHRHFDIKTSNIFTLPGSHIYKVACERGIIHDPVKFLKNGCPLINITKMTNDEWANINDEIVVSEIIRDGAAFDIDASDIASVFDAIAKSEYKTAIWPAVVDTIRFVKKLSDALYQKAYFVNMNPGSLLLRCSMEDFNCNVHKPDIISTENIDIVICPRNGIYDEIRKICEEQYPLVKKVVNVPEIMTLKEWLV
jgi:radical SAM superfamily enzyme YgiQ (UPF0313 family)